jgi:hypothetical protein
MADFDEFFRAHREGITAPTEITAFVILYCTACYTSRYSTVSTECSSSLRYEYARSP